jgi:hypothetical protein
MGKVFIGNRITGKRAPRSYGEMKNVFALPMRIRGGLVAVWGRREKETRKKGDGFGEYGEYFRRVAEGSP